MKGFTLIETLAAIAVILIVTVGALTLAQRSLSAATFAKDQTTAFYLAQDATESIKNIRDTNIRDNNPGGWLNGLSGTCTGGNKCTIDTSKTDTISNIVKTCTGSCAPLRYNPTTNQYGHTSSWQESKFTREVAINVLNPAREIAVSVTIRWKSGVLGREFTIRQNLYDIF